MTTISLTVHALKITAMLLPARLFTTDQHANLHVRIRNHSANVYPKIKLNKWGDMLRIFSKIFQRPMTSKIHRSRSWHREVYITGPNTNGRKLAHQNLNPARTPQRGVSEWDLTIGSSRDCWITLPDPSAPEIMAVMINSGHHTFLCVLKPGCSFNLDIPGNFTSSRAELPQHQVGAYLVEWGDLINYSYP